MSAELWVYTGVGVFLGICILWIVVTEIRLWNYAKTILHLENQARVHMEQISITQRQIYDMQTNKLGVTPDYPPRGKAKKGKRKR